MLTAYSDTAIDLVVVFLITEKEYAKSLETSRNDVGCKHMASEMESSRIRDEDIVRSA